MVDKSVNNLLPIDVGFFEVLDIFVFQGLSIISVRDISIVFRFLSNWWNLLIIHLGILVILIFWRVCIIKSCEELMSDDALRLLNFLERSTLSINDAENGFPWFSNDLSDIHHAFVGILNN